MRDRFAGSAIPHHAIERLRAEHEGCEGERDEVVRPALHDASAVAKAASRISQVLPAFENNRARV